MAGQYLVSAVKQISDNFPQDFAAKSHVLGSDGAIAKFRNTHPSSDSLHDSSSVFPILMKVVRLELTGKLPSPDTTPPTVNVRKPTFLPARTSSTKLRATWLGHSCYYVEFPSGLRVLFDPVFEDRCSPVSWFGQTRFTKQPCMIGEIPVVDAVVISHSHYDHLSAPSVKDLKTYHPDAHSFVGLGLDRVAELDCWEVAKMVMTPKRLPSKGEIEVGSNVEQQERIIPTKFSCLPDQQSSGRTGLDKDTTLWCSWGVSSFSSSSAPIKTSTAPSDLKSVFFSGDTGYRAVPEQHAETDHDTLDSLPVCPHFSQIGLLRGPFDFGLIPIAEYKPRHIMSSVHADPFDAVEIFRDTRCKRAMGIHWGTWAQTFENVLEPPVLLREALRRKGMEEGGVFDVCEIGEAREF